MSWSYGCSLVHPEHGSGREACHEEALLVSRPDHVFGIRVGDLGAAPAEYRGHGAGKGRRASRRVPGNFGAFCGVLER